MFTFSGMYVFWPPSTLRPRTRLENEIGIRRWPWSMKMIPTVSTSISRMTARNWNVEEFACRMPSWLGSWLTMLTKMISDMPLPMPRWVISSPSHMMSAVPAVMVITMVSTLRKV